MPNANGDDRPAQINTAVVCDTQIVEFNDETTRSEKPRTPTIADKPVRYTLRLANA